MAISRSIEGYERDGGDGAMQFARGQQQGIGMQKQHPSCKERLVREERAKKLTNENFREWHLRDKEYNLLLACLPWSPQVLDAGSFQI